MYRLFAGVKSKHWLPSPKKRPTHVRLDTAEKRVYNKVTNVVYHRVFSETFLLTISFFVALTTYFCFYYRHCFIRLRAKRPICARILCDNTTIDERHEWISRQRWTGLVEYRPTPIADQKRHARAESDSHQTDADRFHVSIRWLLVVGLGQSHLPMSSLKFP